MSSAKLRKIGGSVMVAIPPAVLAHLRLQSGATVDVAIEDGRIAVTPTPARRYALDALLAEHAKMREIPHDADWTRSQAKGRELI